MGYIVTAFSVDLAELSAALGSKNQPLMLDIIETFEDGFEQYDEMAANSADEEADQPPLTMRDALTQMVMGEKCAAEFAFLYGYAFEFLCRYFGESLPNGEWSAMPRGTLWAEKVDQALEDAGVPADMLRVGRHMMFRGTPIAIPQPEDFPSIGYLKRDEVKAAHQALGEANLAAIADRQVRASIDQVGGLVEDVHRLDWQTWSALCVGGRRRPAPHAAATRSSLAGCRAVMPRRCLATGRRRTIRPRAAPASTRGRTPVFLLHPAERQRVPCSPVTFARSSLVDLHDAILPRLAFFRLQ